MAAEARSVARKLTEAAKANGQASIFDTPVAVPRRKPNQKKRTQPEQEADGKPTQHTFLDGDPSVVRTSDDFI